MNIFHEIWVAAGPYLIFCAVVLSPVVLGFIWICVRDCLLFGWIEARACAGRGFGRGRVVLSCPSEETRRALPCDEPVRRVLWFRR